MRVRTDVRRKIEKWAGQCLDEGQAGEEVRLAHPACCHHLGLHARSRKASHFAGEASALCDDGRRNALEGLCSLPA